MCSPDNKEPSKKITGQNVYMALLSFKNTSRENLGSPVQRLFNRTRTTTPISEDLQKPTVLQNTTEHLAKAHLKQKYYHDVHAKPSESVQLKPNQNIML